MIGEVNDSRHLSLGPLLDMSFGKGKIAVLDRIRQTTSLSERRRTGGYLLPITFLSVAAAAMLAWIAAIGWACWRLIAWLL